MWTKLIATRNDAHRLESCLKSLNSFPGPTIVVDAGKDNTKRVADEFSVSHLPVAWQNDWSSIRNAVGSAIEGWSIWIEPWEEVIELPDPPEEPTNLSVTLISGNWVSYPARAFHSNAALTFSNPTFESADAEAHSGIVLIGNGGRPASETEKIITDWASREPANHQVPYYRAMHRLSCGDVLGFRTAAHEYLFRDSKTSDSGTLIKLYLGLVESKSNPSVAMGWLAEALADKPWLAEAWFASAEICRAAGHLGRAAALYKAAIEFGKHRPNDERLPVDVSKYREEPEKILKAIAALNSKT